MSIIKMAVTVSLFATMLSGRVDAQSIDMPRGETYDRAEVFLPDNSRFEASDLEFEDDRVSFNREDQEGRTSLALSDVAAIRVQTGNEGGRWAAYGAVSGALTGALTAYQLNNNTSGFVETETSYTPWVLGGAAVMAGAMYIVGSTRSTWEGVYSSQTSALRVVPHVDRTSVGLLVSLKVR